MAVSRAPVEAPAATPPTITAFISSPLSASATLRNFLITMCARANASPIRDDVDRRLRDRRPPGEVGKEISEHRAHTLDEKDSSGAEANGRDRVMSIIGAVLLAVVSVLAARPQARAGPGCRSTSRRSAARPCARARGTRPGVKGRTQQLKRSRNPGRFRNIAGSIRWRQ